MTVTGERIGHQIAVTDKEFPIEYFTFFTGYIYNYMCSYSKLKVRRVRDDNQQILFSFCML